MIQSHRMQSACAMTANRHRADLLDRHFRVGYRGRDATVLGALLVWPWRVDDDDTIWPVPAVAAARRESPRPAGQSSAAMDAVHAAVRSMSASSLPKLLRLGLGGIDDGLSLLERAPRHAGGFGGLVGGAAVRTFGQLARMFTGAPRRSFAAARSIGSNARLMATASDSVKSLRMAFSANSPRRRRRGPRR